MLRRRARTGRGGGLPRARAPLSNQHTFILAGARLLNSRGYTAWGNTKPPIAHFAG